MAFKVAARLLCCFAILPGENGDLVIGRILRVGEREPNAGAHLARCASADRIHDQKSCAGLREGSIDILGRASFIDSSAGKFFAHGDDHNFWVHVTSGKYLRP